MTKHLIVGGSIYKQALQAPKEVVFEEVQPYLQDLHKQTLDAKKRLWESFWSDPGDILRVLQKLLKVEKRIRTSQDADLLNEWASSFEQVGSILLDNASKTEENLGEVGKTLQSLETLRRRSVALSKQSLDSGYNQIVEALDSFLEDMKTPIL